MGLGGPVWHASAMPTHDHWVTPPRRACHRFALAALEGVGDAGLGQWEEWTGAAYHVRRRLAPDEQLAVGPVVDVRHTDEARRRIGRLPATIRAQLPAVILLEEVGRDQP
jgi:hypothetical protein